MFESLEQANKFFKKGKNAKAVHTLEILAAKHDEVCCRKLLQLAMLGTHHPEGEGYVVSVPEYQNPANLKQAAVWLVEASDLVVKRKGYGDRQRFLLALLVTDEAEQLDFMTRAAVKGRLEAVWWLLQHGLMERACPDEQQRVNLYGSLYMRADSEKESLWLDGYFSYPSGQSSHDLVYKNQLAMSQWIFEKGGFFMNSREETLQDFLEEYRRSSREAGKTAYTLETLQYLQQQCALRMQLHARAVLKQMAQEGSKAASGKLEEFRQRAAEDEQRLQELMKEEQVWNHYVQDVLGMQLVDKDGREVRLTPDGKTYKTGKSIVR